LRQNGCVMRKYKTIIITFLAFFCPIFISQTALAEPANLTLLKNELKHYHDSGEYNKELNEVLKKAEQYMIFRANSNTKQAHPEKLAIVLDIDETSLSNYDNMVMQEFANTREQIEQYTHAAIAPAIKPTLALYNDALKHGVNVFFVTGRHESSLKMTVKNLIRAGYHDWTDIILKPEQFHEKSVIPYKTQAREKISQKGYVIIENIGDQSSDLQGGYAEKFYKLPNPYYYIP